MPVGAQNSAANPSSVAEIMTFIDGDTFALGPRARAAAPTAVAGRGAGPQRGSTPFRNTSMQRRMWRRRVAASGQAKSPGPLCTIAPKIMSISI